MAILAFVFLIAIIDFIMVSIIYITIIPIIIALISSIKTSKLARNLALQVSHSSSEHTFCCHIYIIF